ncbi:MAG TPA: EAL domain-containing protein [Acidimicrobiia bacterium]
MPSQATARTLKLRGPLDPSAYVAFDRVPVPTFVLELIDRHEPSAFHCTYVNASYRSLLGDAHIAHPPEECMPLGSVALAEPYLETASASATSITFEDPLTFPGRVFEMVVAPVFDRDGRPVQYIGTAHEVTSRVEVAAQLDFLQRYDELTGLANRATFHERLSGVLPHIDDFDTRVALMLVDLDEFTMINNSLGHTVGDDVICTIARRIEDVLRFGDWVARLGGDEFAIVCGDVASMDDALAVARRVVAAITEPIPIGDDTEVVLHASAGLVLASDARDESARMLRDADAALLAAKSGGRNRVEIFDDAMRTDAIAKLELVNDLHRAVREHEFEIFYQPQVEFADAAIVGFEALIRWRHPTRGLLEPNDFIPRAEESGLIVPIGAWVIDEVCRQAARWKAATPELAPLVVSVNLSARQLAHPDLVDTVSRALATSGIAPSSLALEVTESMLMEDPELCSDALHALRALGVLLAVDDFGTGQSSLGYLKHLPVDCLKIDQTFVDGLGHDPDDTAIVDAVVRLGHALGLAVTAEGIETNEQLRELAALGCDIGQGYYFARPQPGEVVGALVRHRLRWIPHAQAS